MEDNRIQNQIAIYMTNKKLCEFTDKLKPAPIEYYAHMHAQGEEQADGIRAYSCIGVVLQDYSNGTGDKTVRVTANLSPGFFPFVLSRMQNNLDRFDFTLHRTVKRVAAVAFKAKGCNPVGDQPGRRHFTAQALFDVVEVLITQRAQEPPDRNPGG